jgi:hypothetical protein
VALSQRSGANVTHGAQQFLSAALWCIARSPSGREGLLEHAPDCISYTIEVGLYTFVQVGFSGTIAWKRLVSTLEPVFDILVSKFACKFNLYRYIEMAFAFRPVVAALGKRHEFPLSVTPEEEAIIAASILDNYMEVSAYDNELPAVKGLEFAIATLWLMSYSETDSILGRAGTLRHVISFCSQNTVYLMTAGMFHVINLDTPRE